MLSPFPLLIPVCSMAPRPGSFGVSGSVSGQGFRSSDGGCTGMNPGARWGSKGMYGQKKKTQRHNLLKPFLVCVSACGFSAVMVTLELTDKETGGNVTLVGYIYSCIRLLYISTFCFLTIYFLSIISILYIY